MKRIILSIAFITTTILSYAQIGIGTTNPQSTLDIIGKPTTLTQADGILPPRILRSELINKTAYSADQKGAIIYVTDLSGTINTQTINITKTGLYIYDGTIWNSLENTGNNYVGDVKTGFQSTDHNGWIKLDGRLLTTLTTTQQTTVASLGFTVNLPDANNSYLSQNGSTLGSVSGNNSKTILQTNLPNINLTGTGTFRDAKSFVAETSDGNTAYGTSTILNSWSVIKPISVSVPLGGSGTAIDIKPQTLSINTFVYLGE